MHKNTLLKKGLVVGIIVLFIGVSIASSTSRIDKVICQTSNFDGSLLGYVNDTFGNPIEGALVRVHFHETYEEDYSDSTGFYHVTNIPICYCLKNATCSKEGYQTEWVLLSIAENTTYDFVLESDNHPPSAPDINGKWVIVRFEIECYLTAIDPDGDDVRYYIDWSDTTSDFTDFHKSGETATVRHIFSIEGAFTISAYAEDIYGTRGPENTYTPGWKIKANTKSISDEKISENDVELEDNPVTSPTDDYREIITHVDAHIYDYWEVFIEKDGLLGKYPWIFGFYILNIDKGDIKDIIQLKGLRFKKFGFPIFPIYEYFEVSATEVYSEWYYS